jgi:hypothetical protein
MNSAIPKFPGTALQGIHHLSALRAALSVWRSASRKGRSATANRRSGYSAVAISPGCGSCSIPPNTTAGVPDRPCRSVFLLRHRHHHPGGGILRQRPAAAAGEDVLFKVGRAYPAFWEANGQGGQCPVPGGMALDDRAKRWRCPTTRTGKNTSSSLASTAPPTSAAHWEYLLRPLALYHSDREGLIALPANRIPPDAVAGLSQLQRSPRN